MIDYLGRRVLVTASLPIDHSEKNSTLLYGSNDGGENIVTQTDDEVVVDMMKRLSQSLNLKEHYVGLRHPFQLLYVAFDIEWHKGTDGRYYVIDTARLLPPQDPNMRNTLQTKQEEQRQQQQQQHSGNKNNNNNNDDDNNNNNNNNEDEDEDDNDNRISFYPRTVITSTGNVVSPLVGRTRLYELLRPEFVRHFQKPLSDDSHILSEKWKGNTQLFNKDIEDATFALLRDVIPQFCFELLSPLQRQHTTTHERYLTGDKTITSHLHRKGINVRFLGRVRAYLTSEVWRKILLSEMAARVLKDELKSELHAVGSTQVSHYEVCVCVCVCIYV